MALASLCAYQSQCFLLFLPFSRVRFLSSRHLGTRVVGLLFTSAFRLPLPLPFQFISIFLGRQSHLAAAI